MNQGIPAEIAIRERSSVRLLSQLARRESRWSYRSLSLGDAHRNAEPVRIAGASMRCKNRLMVINVWIGP